MMGSMNTTFQERPRRILLVDDSDAFVRTARDFFRTRDALTIESADSGTRALQVADQFDPDVVLLDFSMPDMNGIECARRMRSSGSRAAIVLVSAHDLGPFEEAARGAGVDGFIGKQSFATAVGRWLAGAPEDGQEMDLNRNPPRLTSGIEGLDQVLGGGFVVGHSYLVVGKAGTGKTVFGLQWLREGLRQGEHGLYVTLAESAREIKDNAASFGWSLDGMALADLSPARDDSMLDEGEYRVFSPSEVENEPAWSAIAREIERQRPKRVVIDSLTQLRYLSNDAYQFRKQVVKFVNFLNSRQCTSLLCFEPTELVNETAAALAVNGVIHLRSGISPKLAVGLRSLQVEKMRATSFMAGLHPLRLGPQGHVVFPHVVEAVGSTAVSPGLLDTGIAALDQLLGGGLEEGTTTLLSGPAGAGKSTLGTHFAARQALRRRASIFTFEESAQMLLGRARATGAAVDGLVESGHLSVHRVSPLEHYPDEFLGKVRHAVEVEGSRIVMIDSLRGYTLAMEEFGSPQAHIHNLVAYLTRMGVTTILVSEVEHITGPSLVATDVGVGHLTDNIILMRHAEDAGRVLKVISCLKKRLGSFEPDLRELHMSSAGITVGAKLQHLRAVLTGTPVALDRLAA